MFEQVLTVEGFCLVALGTLLGITVGAVPGLTGAMLISLSLPLTFSMEGTSAMLLLVSMYVGAVSGGLISATLLRMPGTPASVMTTLDGYPMARQGKARRALVLGAGASLFGGLISWGFLVLLAKPVSELSTRFGPFEFFSLVLMALAMIAGLGGSSGVLRGLFAGALGMLAAMPGLSPATGDPRWTFGIPAMSDGFKLLPVLIGLFAINQVLRELLGLAGKPEELGGQSERSMPRVGDWFRQVGNMLRSSCIGTWVGILPGAGANVGSVLAYSAAKGMSKQSDKFGTGCDEGVVASESANNATVGGALIPLVAMGIPGSLIDAILLGAFVLHGLQPGPLLFQNHPEVVDSILGAALVAHLLMFASMFWLARG
ncbi:MAG: tripartite tricarboxylate transporter permease, partial [Opitutae bacterium]